MNIALIGYGYWGPNIAKNIVASSKMNLYAICDHNPVRLIKAQATYLGQTKYTLDYGELLENPEIDCIAVAVETEAHYRIAKDILFANKDLFIEKPFTDSVEQATELASIARERNLAIHIDHIMIYNQIIKKTKQMIDKGELGELIYIDSSRMNLGKIKPDVNAMWDLAVHDLAVIDYLGNGQEPYQLTAMGEKCYGEQETLTYLTLKYNGFIAHLKSSWISPLKERRMIIAGTKKMIVFDDMKTVEKLMIYDNGIEVTSYQENPEYEDYAIKVRTGDLFVPFIPEEDALKNSLEHFAGCVADRANSISGPEQAIRILKILENADKCLHSEGLKYRNAKL